MMSASIRPLFFLLIFGLTDICGCHVLRSDMTGALPELTWQVVPASALADGIRAIEETLTVASKSGRSINATQVMIVSNEPSNVILQPLPLDALGRGRNYIRAVCSNQHTLGAWADDGDGCIALGEQAVYNIQLGMHYHLTPRKRATSWPACR